MTKEELAIAKQKMKDYRDIYGNELSRKDLIDDAKNIIDLDDIFSEHHEEITKTAKNAQLELERFKRAIGVY